MAEYKRAPEVERIALEVMEKHHSTLEQRGPRIEYVFTKSSSSSGSVSDWKLRRITGIHAYCALPTKPDNFGFPPSPFLVLEVSTMWWALLDGDGGRKEAFLDHVLEHLTYDYEKGAWPIEKPEFGEFPNVLKRRGFWRPDNRLKRFAKTMGEQLSLLDEEPEEDQEDEGEDAGEEDGSGEAFDVSITHGGRTVETNTETLRKTGAEMTVVRGGRSS